MNGYSARYDAALVLAASAHRNQLRKGTTTPYIAHVVHVSTILLRHSFAENLVIAGLLHDVVEDCDVTVEELSAQFGEEVGRLVEAVSERKAVDGMNLPWEQRKTEKLALLREGGPEVAALKAADALHNARSIAADLETLGPALWARFQRGPQPSLWYYREILASVRHWLGDHPLVQELSAAVDDVARLVDTHAAATERP